MTIRDEAFWDVLKVIIRLQREGALSYEQVQELNRVVCHYGTACALDVAMMARRETGAAQ